MEESNPSTQTPKSERNSLEESSHHINSKESLKLIKNVDKKSSVRSSTYSHSLWPENESVVLREDVFGRYIDENGKENLVSRFTWKNRNNIQVQVINYGARVTSIKLPDRKGEIEDIVLGFDDIAGYLFYDKHYFGATIGRYSNVIQNSTFRLDSKSYIVTSNQNGHCFNGGRKGLDKVMWNTHVSGKRLIMSYVSPHMSDGFPGDLLVRITFELSSRNEFKISMDAQTTCPTIVNLSNLLYFNLAGHHKGPDEIYKHMLTMNCNCFTPVDFNYLPTSEIINVMHTPFDFQIPKLLGKIIGIVPKDGINQNLCVNRGMYQGECFVGRLLHVPSGRMAEVYSNQPGVQILTANDFGHGQFKTMKEIMDKKLESNAVEISIDPVMLVYEKVHNKVTELLQNDKERNYEQIKNLLIKFNDLKKRKSNSLTEFLSQGIELSPLQIEYLQKAKEIVCESIETDDACLDLKEALSNILKAVKPVDQNVRSSSKEENTEIVPKLSERELLLNNKEMPIERKSDPKFLKGNLQVSDALFKEVILNEESSKKASNLSQNKIPAIYKDSEVIRGKAGAVYRAHGGVALQTQNYPNAPNLKNFPNCELKPGEVYKHDIVYRFWIRAGNPTKWVKRNEATRNSKL